MIALHLGIPVVDRGVQLLGGDITEVEHAKGDIALGEFRSDEVHHHVFDDTKDVELADAAGGIPDR